MATYADQLKDLEKTLAGFHKDHYIRDSLIARIAILRVKAQEEKSILADPSDPRNPSATISALKGKVQSLQKTLAGFHPAHYIRDSIQSDIIAIQIQIKKKMRN